jgi:hypothetical protein
LLTKADDYPIHQTPDPVITSSDRNCYDRYFFNGHSIEGDLFFGATFGVYPYLNVMDGAFCVAVDGVQHNLRVSRRMGWERMDTHAGPLSVEVIEPLKRLRVRVAANEHGVEADLVFTGRSHPMEEPRQRTFSGGRVSIDLTRMTQNGRWEGWISVHGKRIEVKPETAYGTRDRSWGLRQIGVPRDPRQVAWVWAPLQAADREFLFYAIENAEGDATVQGGQMVMLDGSGHEHMADAFAELEFQPGTRQISKATLQFTRRRRRGDIEIVLTPRIKNRMFLNGLGYGHLEWAHGMDKGELAVSYDTLEPGAITVHAPPYMHATWAQYEVQVDAVAKLPGGETLQARGILEQLIVGDYHPAGLKGYTDGYAA